MTVEVYKQTVDGATVWYYADSGAVVEETKTIYDEDGATVLWTEKTEISGTPTQKIDKIPNGYSAGNRIWNDGDLPLGYDAKYSTSQGSGSCYTFYADPTELNTILGVLELMRVAFVDANGELLAIAKLDTQYCFSEYGRHLVPLVLYSGYDEKTVTDKTGQTTTYRTIMDLNTNEATLISALVYLEGNSIENKDVLASADIKGQFNIQFTTTYDENALKDEELMNEKIIVSAEIADKSQTGTTYVKTVTATVTGMKAKSVTANFTRRISSTQGSVYFPKDLSFTETSEGSGQWVCDFTFATPGTYILRSITVDGQERMLEEPQTFTIEGFKIESLQSGYGSNYTYMSAGSYFTDTFTLSIKGSKDYKVPNTIKGIFTNEDNVNVDLNFKKTGSSSDDSTWSCDWSANVTFNASGTYTLRYLLIDGEYYEVNPFIREIVLGLKTRVWLTAPGAEDFMESEEYKYDRVNDVYTYFYMSKEHKFEAKLEIYDEAGNEIRQLGGATGVDLVYGNVTAKLKWNPSTDSYSGAALTLNAPGSYAFTSVIIPMENGNQTVTASVGAPRVVVATKDPYVYQETRLPVAEFNAIVNPNPSADQYPRVDLFFEHASSATMYGKFKITTSANDTAPEYIVLKAEYYPIDETKTNGYFSFKIPTDEYGKFSDGFYQLVEVKFTNVTKVKGGKFYQSNEKLDELKDGEYVFDNPDKPEEFLTFVFSDEAALAEDLVETKPALAKIKIIANPEITVEDGKSITSTFIGEFMQSHPLFGDGIFKLVIQDFEGKAITGLGNFSLTIQHRRETMNQYYTVSDGDYANIPSAFIQVTLNDDDGDGVYSAELPTKEIFLVGTYSVTLETVEENTFINNALLSKMPGAINVRNTVLPTIAITGVSPTGTGSVDKTDSNADGSHIDNHKASAFSNGYADVYFRCNRSGEGTTCDPYRHNYSRPSVTITLANMGYADSAALVFGSNVHVYNDTTQTNGFAWTANGTCARNIGYYQNKTAANDSKTAAGTISASTLTLTKDGITYMIPISSMNLTDLNGNVVTSVTINNPY